jgi:hypothetical protein
MYSINKQFIKQTKKIKCSYCYLRLYPDEFEFNSKICNLCYKYSQKKSLYLVFD